MRFHVKCTQGPNGELIETGTSSSANSVGMVKRDGTFLFLVRDDTIDKNTSTADGPALTVAQLTAIALDPAFSIKR